MSQLDLSFPHDWQAEVLNAPPMIAPARQFVYPQRIAGEEEAMGRGALLLKVRSVGGGEFLGTCMLGFNDPALPRGVWACPNPKELCAVAGGYGYVIDTTQPESSIFVKLRPVVAVYPAVERGMLLLQGFHTLMAWGAEGQLWETGRLSWEGIRDVRIDGDVARGLGWDLMADKEVEFIVDLRTGKHTGGGVR